MQLELLLHARCCSIPMYILRMPLISMLLIGLPVNFQSCHQVWARTAHRLLMPSALQRPWLRLQESYDLDLIKRS